MEKIKREIKENVERAIKKKVVLSSIGSGTIQKQFFNYHAGKNASATADDAIDAYNLFAAEMKRLYERGYGSTKLVEILKEYYIVATEKTILGWLRAQGVETRAPLRERTRQPSGTWETALTHEIERLKDELGSSERAYRSGIVDLSNCEFALRISTGEKRSIARRLEACREELKDCMLNR